MPLELIFYNRQRTIGFDLPFIRRMAEAAREACVESVLSPDMPLASLDHVDVSILSDKAIAQVHGDFFDDPTPTDVITFQHGELLLGAGILVENAREYGHSPSDEAALCVIHGLLHLAGWDDLTAKEAKKMAKQQERIFKMARRVLG